MSKLRTREIKWYGWKADTPDHRDLYFAARKPLSIGDAPLPPAVDLTSQCPVVYDQGQLGSCTANAIAAALEFDMIKQKEKDVMPSRLFIYYNERVMEGSVDQDAGAEIRDGIKSVASQGDCPEKRWPYNIKKFAKKPGKECYKEALRHKAVEYYRIETDVDMKTCLAAGYPFVFGFSVYESFESQDVAKTGNVPMPGPNEQLLGGHATLCIGYNDADQRFLVRNSWGKDWGMQGNFTLPYAYLTDRNLSDDMWYIKVVS